MSGPGTHVAQVGASNLPVAAGETSSSAIAAREKAAVEARFLMALHRPRDFETSRRRLMDACRRPAFAEVARYSKPVGGERITGLSIRFAEEARVMWGNMDVTTLLVFDDEERRIYRVQGIDLETNATESKDVMIEKFVERRKTREGMEIIGSRTNSTGQTVYKVRATEDDLMVKANAAISKERRNVILSLLPGDVKEECEQQAIDTLSNVDANDPAASRKKLLDAFWKYGVTPAQVAELLGHPVEQINPAEMTLLRTYGTALKEGESTWPDIVEAHTAGKKTGSTQAPESGATKGTEGLKAKLGKNGQRSAEPAAQAAVPAKDAAAPASEKCRVCFRSDGTHEPNAPCYEEAERARLAAEEVAILEQDRELEKAEAEARR
jgi:hypothetical protein